MLWLPSIWFGNKWRSPFFPVPAPEMIWSITEGQESTNMSLGDREITPGWQKASATSITCTVLPAIIRSLKAIFQRFQRWGPSVPLRFYPDDWPERHLLMLWFMAADFIALFPATPSFSHISHVVLYPLSLLMLSRYFFFFILIFFIFFHPTVICHLAPHKTRKNNNSGQRCFIYVY